MQPILPLLKSQKEFVLSNYRHTGLVAGFGSGKTEAGVSKVIIKKLQYVGVNVAYYLPTYNLISDIAIPRISEKLTELGLTFEVNQSKKHFEVFNGGISIGKIIMRTMDNPALIVGYEVGYSLIDECDVLPKKKMTSVFKQILARNRSKLPNDVQNCTDMVGTPEGFKWFYEFFVTNINENKKLIKAKTKDNPYLPSDYVETLTDSYSPEQLEAYLNGEFVNLTAGTVFNSYDRKENYTDREVLESDKLHIGMDFNITKMSAVIHVFDNDIMKAVYEITDAYDTTQLSELIKAKYPSHSIVIYPDASGDNRNTSGKTDIEVLKSHGFKIRILRKNPYVKDRINETNRRLRDKTYMVNSNTCVQYSDALTQLAYKNGVPDKASGLDHVVDAGTYPIWWQKTGTFKLGASTRS